MLSLSTGLSLNRSLPVRLRWPPRHDGTQAVECGGDAQPRPARGTVARMIARMDFDAQIGDGGSKIFRRGTRKNKREPSKRQVGEAFEARQGFPA